MAWKHQHTLHTILFLVLILYLLQPNLMPESGIHSSLHANYHQQIAYAKFKLNTDIPPPNLQNVWHYRDTNTEPITRAIEEFN